MLRALAAGGQGWLNVHVTTVSKHAISIWDASCSPRSRFLSREGAVVLLEKLIQDLDVPFSSPITRSGSSIANTVRTLRKAGVSTADYQSVCRLEGEHQVAELYHLYESYLSQRNLVDEADILVSSAKTLEQEPNSVRPELVVILDEVVLSELELDYVRTLSRWAASVFRIGPPAHASDAREETAGFLLRDWPLAKNSKARMHNRATYRVMSAVGVENEIRAVFRDMVGKGLPLDSVELVYASREPYIRAIRSLADRIDIDITLAKGYEMTSTRVGQAIRQFLQWIGDGQSSSRLVQMLRGGFVHLGKSNEDGSSISVHAANILSTVHLTGGAKFYHHVFEQHQKKLEHELRAARGSFVEDDRTRSLEIARSVADALQSLLSLGEVNSEATLAEISGRVERFVEAYVFSVDENDEPSVEQTIIDTIDLILSVFRRLSDEVTDRLPRSVLVRRMQDILDTRRCEARKSSPASLHVVPFSQAGYSDRPNLYVVGLDELTMATHVSENPFLPDDLQQRLEKGHDHRLITSKETAEDRPRNLEFALARATGAVTLVYNCYDVSDGRELYPSSVLRSISDGTDVPETSLSPQSYVPDSNDPEFGLPLDRTDVILALKDQNDAAEKCDRLYPWIGRGRNAIRQRESESWTPFDGQVQISSRQKNPYSGRVRWSASRLETLTACPFRYFLKNVLKARTLDEREDDVWMSPLEKGLLVHDILATFMSSRSGPIAEPDTTQLEELFLSAVDDFARTRSAPNPAVEEEIRSELRMVARAFICDEIERQEYAEPYAFEFGFGIWPQNRKSDTDRTEKIIIDLDGLSISLLGRIDRIDRVKTGGFAITDYKTGTSSEYDAEDLLNDGRSLQWALYAYVVEELLGESVNRSGYLFPSSRELGRRIEADPSAFRQEVAAELRRVGRLVQAGSFFQAADDNGACKFCDYQRVCGNVSHLKTSIRFKVASTQTDMPHYELLSDWKYAEKHLPGAS